MFDAVGGKVNLILGWVFAQRRQIFDDCLKSLTWEGRIVVVGFASGEIPKVLFYCGRYACLTIS